MDTTFDQPVNQVSKPESAAAAATDAELGDLSDKPGEEAVTATQPLNLSDEPEQLFVERVSRNQILDHEELGKQRDEAVAAADNPGQGDIEMSIPSDLNHGHFHNADDSNDKTTDLVQHNSAGIVDNGSLGSIHATCGEDIDVDSVLGKDEPEKCPEVEPNAHQDADPMQLDATHQDNVLTEEDKSSILDAAQSLILDTVEPSALDIMADLATGENHTPITRARRGPPCPFRDESSPEPEDIQMPEPQKVDEPTFAVRNEEMWTEGEAQQLQDALKSHETKRYGGHASREERKVQQFGAAKHRMEMESSANPTASEPAVSGEVGNPILIDDDSGSSTDDDDATQIYDDAVGLSRDFVYPVVIDDGNKPDLSLGQIIILALVKSPRRALTAQGICDQIKSMFSWYKDKYLCPSFELSFHVEMILINYDFPVGIMLEPQTMEPVFTLSPGAEWFVLNRPPRSANTPFRLLDLPFELRLMIYTYVLSHPLPPRRGWELPSTYLLNVKRLDRPRQSTSLLATTTGGWRVYTRSLDVMLALTMVNKQLHEEATRIFYRTNTFYFMSPQILGRFYAGIQNRTKWLRTIILNFCPPRHGHECKRSIVRLLFTRLRNLHIIVNETQLLINHVVHDIQDVPGVKFLGQLYGLDRVTFAGDYEQLKSYLEDMKITEEYPQAKGPKYDTDEAMGAAQERNKKENTKSFVKHYRKFRRSEQSKKRKRDEEQVRSEKASLKQQKSDARKLKQELLKQQKELEKLEREEEREKKKQADEDAKQARREAREQERKQKQREKDRVKAEKEKKDQKKYKAIKKEVQKNIKGKKPARKVSYHIDTSSEEGSCVGESSADEGSVRSVSPTQHAQASSSRNRHNTRTRDLEAIVVDSGTESDVESVADDDEPPMKVQKTAREGSIKVVANGLKSLTAGSFAAGAQRRVDVAAKRAARQVLLDRGKSAGKRPAGVESAEKARVDGDRVSADPDF